MINYKQILADLSSIAYHHMQINSFGFGTLDQCTMDIRTKQEPKYSRMYVVPGTTNFTTGQISYNFSIIFMDKVEEDLSDLEDVMSDQLEIAKDIWTVFYQSYTAQYGNFSFEIVGDWNSQLVPFTERFETVLAGWTLNITLVTPFDYTECGLPIALGFYTHRDESYASYKVILNDLKSFADLHYQVNSFGFGPLEQITVDRVTKQEPLYTRMYVVPEVTSLLENEVQITFNIIVLDRIEEDLSNQEYVLSDTLEIIKDLFSLIYLSDYEVDEEATVEPFIERFETLLGGWTMTVNITQKFDYNRCDLPMRPFTVGLTWSQVAELWNTIDRDWKNV